MWGAWGRPSGAGHAARLDGQDRERAVGVGRAATEAAERRSRRRPRRRGGRTGRPGRPATSRRARRGPARRLRRGRGPGSRSRPACHPERRTGRRARSARSRGTDRRSATASAAAHGSSSSGSSNGVCSRPRRTMSNRKASAHSGIVVVQVEARDRGARGPRIGDRVEDRILRKSGSPGKYIWVTSRCGNASPNSEKWMCAGRQALRWLLPRVGAGLDRHEPVATLASVSARPTPVKFGSSGAGCWSLSWR